MTTPLWSDPGAEAVGAETSAAAPARPARRWGRVALVIAVVLGAAVLIGRAGATGASSAAYHPSNPTANGSQALARVLAARGVSVIVAEGDDALHRAGIDQDTTIVVTNTSELRETTLNTLAIAAAAAERLVLVRPERRVVRALTPNVSMQERPRAQNALVSSCDTPDVRPGERLTRSQAEFADARATTSCYVNDGYAVYLATSGPGLPSVILIGSTDTVTNERADEVENGALALRALGHSGRLVWYVPDLRDVPPTAAAQEQDFSPPWWGPMVLLLLMAALAAFWWRGRRFGRLVVEPLPVVVRAVETTESRGRMYLKARDSNRAGAVLRAASRRRLAAYLSLPSGTTTDAVAQAVSAATRRPLEEIRWLLAGVPVATDTELLDLAVRLAALEKEIRRS